MDGIYKLFFAQFFSLFFFQGDSSEMYRWREKSVVSFVRHQCSVNYWRDPFINSLEAWNLVEQGMEEGKKWCVSLLRWSHGNAKKKCNAHFFHSKSYSISNDPNFSTVKRVNCAIVWMTNQRGSTEIQPLCDFHLDSINRKKNVNQQFVPFVINDWINDE